MERQTPERTPSERAKDKLGELATWLMGGIVYKLSDVTEWAQRDEADDE